MEVGSISGTILCITNILVLIRQIAMTKILYNILIQGKIGHSTKPFTKNQIYHKVRVGSSHLYISLFSILHNESFPNTGCFILYLDKSKYILSFETLAS